MGGTQSEQQEQEARAALEAQLRARFGGRLQGPMLEAAVTEAMALRTFWAGVPPLPEDGAESANGEMPHNNLLPPTNPEEI